MQSFSKDIFTEPEPDPDTLRNLGPLTPLAGIWEDSEVSMSIRQQKAPKTTRTSSAWSCTRSTPRPTDRSSTTACATTPASSSRTTPKPSTTRWATGCGSRQLRRSCRRSRYPEVKWRWRSARPAPTRRHSSWSRKRGSEVNGICSNPFLEYAFKTTGYRIRVTVNSDGTWLYEQDTILLVHDRPEPFHHTDHNTLRKIGEPTPNPMALAAS